MLSTKFQCLSVQEKNEKRIFKIVALAAILDF